MNFPKSTHDLGYLPTDRRSSKRVSRQIRRSKQMIDQQFKIPNPYRGINQQNNLPHQVLSQIQQMQYISPKSIKNIELPQCRRTSGFLKNLQMMQEIVKKQQQKYTGMLNGGQKPLKKKTINMQYQLTAPINIIEDDQVSLELNGFYDYRQRVEDDFNLFQNQCDNYMTAEQPVMFYSNNQIQLCAMDQEVNNYFQ